MMFSNSKNEAWSQYKHLKDLSKLLNVSEDIPYH